MSDYGVFTNKKITQVQLGTETYDIDVAAARKAKPLLQAEDNSDLTKVLPKSAVLKPDGTNDLFDENNKLNSHYISDTILGQLKFGGTIVYDASVNLISTFAQWNVVPSTLLLSKLQEQNITFETGYIFKLQCGIASAITWAIYNPGTLIHSGTIDTIEGFYFIFSGDDPDIWSSDGLVPSFATGDWGLCCNNTLQKIDNTDTITHIDETDGSSLLEITGSSGLKLNGFTRDSSTGDLTLTNNLNTPVDITSEGDITAACIYGRFIEATVNMKAPTITDKTDKSQVVNLEYFENNATKVDWENIDSEVHVVNQHNVEVDGVVTAGGLNVGDIVTVTDKVLVDGDLQVTGDLSFGADSHLVFGTIEGTDFIADYAKVKNAPTEADDVVNKAYFDANKGSGGGSADLSNYVGNVNITGDVDISGTTYLGQVEMSNLSGSNISLDDQLSAPVITCGSFVYDTGTTEDGAFLRYRNGAAIWEVIPSAEGNTF